MNYSKQYQQINLQVIRYLDRFHGRGLTKTFHGLEGENADAAGAWNCRAVLPDKRDRGRGERTGKASDGNIALGHVTRNTWVT